MVWIVCDDAAYWNGKHVLVSNITLYIEYNFLSFETLFELTLSIN